jgi:glycosyltransferase involved in cell wall biosynthesis
LERRRFGKETVYRRVLVNSWKLATAHSRFFIHIHNAALLKGVSYPPEAKIIFYEIPIPPRRASRKRNDTLIWVGFMGRIEQYKGLDTYLEALRLIKKDRGDLAPSIKVLIAGLGDFDAAAFRDLGFETLIDNRYLSDDEFHQYMANLDLLVLPYIEATQSLVAAMGIAYGIRVIASEVGGIPYLVAPYERGTLLPPKDPRALAAAIVSQAEAVLRQDVTQAPGRPFRK